MTDEKETGGQMATEATLLDMFALGVAVPINEAARSLLDHTPSAKDLPKDLFEKAVWEEWARLRYDAADAMLAERNKREG